MGGIARRNTSEAGSPRNRCTVDPSACPQQSAHNACEVAEELAAVGLRQRKEDLPEKWQDRPRDEMAAAQLEVRTVSRGHQAKAAEAPDVSRYHSMLDASWGQCRHSG